MAICLEDHHKGTKSTKNTNRTALERRNVAYPLCPFLFFVSFVPLW
jgi:hypothetical protein